MFSNKNRNTILEQINQSEFDIIVIGGGITGSGIALDAGSRGLNVLLLEKNDFASGTSSKSTKLIHGGLRYLKGLEFKMVAEVGKEREIVHKNAMHLVYPEKMLLPIVKNGTLGKLATGVGLWLYDFLAGVKKSQKRIMLNKEQTIAEEPCLIQENILGGGLYYEYRTNDSRLTIEVLKTAVTNFKVKAINYAKVVKLNYQHEFIEGLEFIDNLDKKKYQVFGKIIINATGPWVDEIRIMDQSMNNKSIVHSKGVHIVIPYDKLPLKHAVYFDVKDARMIFAIPAEGITYVGTTDTFYKEDIENPSITNDDIDYLINTIPQIFNTTKIEKKDIISAWSGVRPLIFETGKKVGELSRHDEVFVSKSGMITIAGGKLTGYRLMAEKTIDKCTKKAFPNLEMSNTATMHLTGGNFESECMMLQELKNYIKEYKTEKVAADKIEKLFYKYGTNTITILENARKSNLPILKAELLYCLEQEMVVTLSDFMFRRTSYALFSPGEFAEAEIDEMLEQIRYYFNYPSENIAEQKLAYYKQINWRNQDI